MTALSATITASIQSLAALATIRDALDTTRPTVTGAKPACTIRRHGRCLKRSQRLTVIAVNREEGANVAKDVVNAPDQPAIFQPSRVTIIIFGPGAACAKA
eukprot:gene14098-14217_t